jgi:hypothetical protein
MRIILGLGCFNYLVNYYLIQIAFAVSGEFIFTAESLIIIFKVQSKCVNFLFTLPKFVLG